MALGHSCHPLALAGHSRSGSIGPRLPHELCPCPPRRAPLPPPPPPPPARLELQGCEFSRNGASGQGAGVALTDGAALDASQSRFVSNGAAPCSAGRPRVRLVEAGPALLRQFHP
jgi:hypothetical protein